jgi:hypothetical protein
MTERTKIVAAAVRWQGVVYTLPPPARHHTINYHIIKTLGLERLPYEPENQGFVDESGRFLNRKQAVVSAMLFDQIKGPQKEIYGGELYSENLW